MNLKIVYACISSIATLIPVLAPEAGAAVLWNTSGLVTNPSAGFNGADVSQFSTRVPSGIQGCHNNGSNFRKVADDFAVPAGGWTITSITGFACMAGTTTFPPPSPITSERVDIYGNLPTGGVGGQTIIATGTAIIDNSWTGIYATVNGATHLMDSNRPIMAVTVDFGSLTLPEGTYGISFSINGQLGSVIAVAIPFAMTTDGSGNPVTLTGNAESGLSTTGNDGTYSWTSLQTASGGVSLPFLINGTAVPAPGAGMILGLCGLVAGRRRRNG